MKSYRTTCFAVSCMAAVAFLAATGTIPTRAQESFDAFAERVAADWMRASPQLATAQQYFSGAEQDALDRQLLGLVGASRLPIDPRLGTRASHWRREFLRRLAAFDRATLTAVQRTSAGLMASNLRQVVASAPLYDHTFVFEQFGGLHVAVVNFLTQTHPIRNARDIENYLARLRLVARELDLGISRDAQTGSDGRRASAIPAPGGDRSTGPVAGASAGGKCLGDLARRTRGQAAERVCGRPSGVHSRG